jgi:iron(III) transport system permease protein
MLFYGSVHTTPPGVAGAFSLDGYRAVLTGDNARILGNTLLISGSKTVLSLGLAVLLAWIVARTDTPCRGLLELLITLPFFIPPILTAMAWGMLANPTVGVVNLAWKWLTGSEHSPFNIYSWGGVVWHMMQYSTAFLFLFIVEAFRTMDPSLEEASRMSGATRARTFRSITLVLMLPALTSAFILSFVRGVESFESPLFFGTPAGVKVITTEIFFAITSRAMPEYQFATAMSFTILALLSLLIFLQWRILGRRGFQTVSGKGYVPQVARLGGWRWLSFGICVLFIAITVLLPVGQLFVGSLFKFFGFYSRDALTFDHYLEVFQDDLLWRAIRNTLLLGVAGSTATMLLGGLIAYVTVYTRWPGHRLIEVLAWLPWLMPGIVLGIGFLWAFAELPGPVQIYGTVWALLFAYLSLSTPVSVRVMSSSFVQLSRDLDECSRVHGASWWQTFWRILIALAWPAFAVGWVLVFFGIMRELSASILLYSVGNEVLSVALLKLWNGGQLEQASVIGLLMMLLVIVFRVVQLLVVRLQARSLAR